MSIIELQRDLEFFPDQDLTELAQQGGDDRYPGWLVDAEMQRRLGLRERHETAQAQQQAANPPDITTQLVSELQRGIGGIPGEQGGMDIPGLERGIPSVDMSQMAQGPMPQQPQMMAGGGLIPGYHRGAGVDFHEHGTGIGKHLEGGFPTGWHEKYRRAEPSPEEYQKELGEPATKYLMGLPGLSWLSTYTDPGGAYEQALGPESDPGYIYKGMTSLAKVLEGTGERRAGAEAEARGKGLAKYRKELAKWKSGTRTGEGGWLDDVISSLDYPELDDEMSLLDYPELSVSGAAPDISPIDFGGRSVVGPDFGPPPPLPMPYDPSSDFDVEGDWEKYFDQTEPVEPDVVERDWLNYYAPDIKGLQTPQSQMITEKIRQLLPGGGGTDVRHREAGPSLFDKYGSSLSSESTLLTDEQRTKPGVSRRDENNVGDKEAVAERAAASIGGATNVQQYLLDQLPPGAPGQTEEDLLASITDPDPLERAEARIKEMRNLEEDRTVLNELLTSGAQDKLGRALAEADFAKVQAKYLKSMIPSSEETRLGGQASWLAGLGDILSGSPRGIASGVRSLVKERQVSERARIDRQKQAYGDIYDLEDLSRSEVNAARDALGDAHITIERERVQRGEERALEALKLYVDLLVVDAQESRADRRLTLELAANLTNNINENLARIRAAKLQAGAAGLSLQEEIDLKLKNIESGFRVFRHMRSTQPSRLEGLSPENQRASLATDRLFIQALLPQIDDTARDMLIASAGATARELQIIEEASGLMGKDDWADMMISNPISTSPDATAGTPNNTRGPFPQVEKFLPKIWEAAKATGPW